jgi:hypothetical protein
MSARSTLFLAVTLVALALGGWRSTVTGLGIVKAPARGADISAAAAFDQAGRALAAYHQTAGTYAGAELSPTSPVRIIWASTVSYCLEGGGVHVVGPGGTPQPGGCPGA